MSIGLNSVFVIDDERFDRVFCERIIRRAGSVSELHLFASAEEALERLKTEPQYPNVIFLDINMPRMNGFDFLAEAEPLLLGKTPSPLVYMLTTSGNVADRERAMAFDCVHAYLNKPLTLQDLMQAADAASARAEPTDVG